MVSTRQMMNDRMPEADQMAYAPKFTKR